MQREWKHILVTFFVMIGMVMMPAKNVKAEEAVVPPSSPVKISNVTLNRTSAQPKQKIKYSLKLKNVSIKNFMNKYSEMYDVYGSSVDKIYLVWYGPNKQLIWKEYKWTGTSKKKKTIKISDEILVREGMEAGEWHLGFIRLFVSGKEDEYFEIYDTRHSRNDEWKDEPTPLMDFSALDFTVSETGKADYAAPTLNLSSIKVSKSYVKRNQKSTFSIKVKDASEIESVECLWVLYKKGNYGRKSNAKLDYKMKYNKKKKRYECSVKFDTKIYRKAELYSISVQDIYGNWKDYKGQYNSHDKWKKYYKAYRKAIIMKK